MREKGLFSFYQDGHKECCGIRKVEPLVRALRARSRAWVTGQRRDQSPGTRAEVPVVQLDPTFGITRASAREVQPARELDVEAGVGLHPRARASRTTPSTTAASSRSAASPARAPSTRVSTSARAAGGGKKRRRKSAGCTRVTCRSSSLTRARAPRAAVPLGALASLRGRGARIGCARGSLGRDDTSWRSFRTSRRGSGNFSLFMRAPPIGAPARSDATHCAPQWRRAVSIDATNSLDSSR